MQRFLIGFVPVILLAGWLTAQQTHAAPPTKSTHASTPANKAQPDNSAPVTPSEETVNSFMQQMLGFNSSTTWKVAEIKPSEATGLTEVTVVITSPQGAQSNRFYVTADGKHAVAGELLPFGAHPFEPSRTKLESGINGVTRGPANSPVTLVEFSDFQCPHCKQVQPNLEKLLSEEKNVRLVFQNFPLPSHDWAQKAAAYADCIGRSSEDAFWKFVQGTYDAQADITAANSDEKLNGIADASGAKSADIAVCATKPDTATRIERSVALGQTVGVNSTPTLFVNGRKLEVGGIPYEVLKSMVEFAGKEGN